MKVLLDVSQNHVWKNIFFYKWAKRRSASVHQSLQAARRHADRAAQRSAVQHRNHIEIILNYIIY